MLSDALRILIGFYLPILCSLCILAFLLGWFAYRLTGRFFVGQDAWCYIDNDGRLLDYSKAFAKAFGLSQNVHIQDPVIFWDVLLSTLGQKQIGLLQDRFQAVGQDGISVAFLNEKKPFVLQIRQINENQPFFVQVLPLADVMEVRSGEIKAQHAGIPLSSIDAAPFLAAYADENQKLVYVNKAWRDFASKALGQGRTHQVFWEMDSFRNQFRRAMRTGLAVQEQILSGHPDSGEAFSLCTLPQSATGGWILASQLVDDALVNAKLDRNLQEVAGLLRSMPLGVALFDKDMRLSTFNSHFAGLFKLEEAWLTARPHAEEMLEILRQRRFLPEVIDFATYKHHFKSFFGQKRQPHEEFLHLPYDRTLRLMFSSYPSGGCLVICQDMTEKLGIAQKKHEAQLVWRSFAQDASEGILLVGNDLAVRFANPALFQFLSPEKSIDQVVGKSVFDVLGMCRSAFLFRAFFDSAAMQLETIFKEKASGSALIFLRVGSLVECKYSYLETGEYLFRFSDQTMVCRALEYQKTCARQVWIEKTLADQKARHLFNRLKTQRFFLKNRHVGDVSKQGEEAEEAVVHFSNLNKAFQPYLSDEVASSGFVRDSFQLQDILDDVLAAYKDVLVRKNVYLQVLGRLDLQVVLNQQRFRSFLLQVLGVVLYEVEAGSALTVCLLPSAKGTALMVSGKVKPSAAENELWSKSGFRMWREGLGDLTAEARKIGLYLCSNTLRASRISLSCVFPRVSIQRSPKDGSRNVLRLPLSA